jgi:hypothetical protein
LEAFVKQVVGGGVQAVELEVLVARIHGNLSAITLSHHHGNSYSLNLDMILVDSWGLLAATVVEDRGQMELQISDRSCLCKKVPISLVKGKRNLT